MEIVMRLPRYNKKTLSVFRLQANGNECRALVATARGTTHSACVVCRGAEGDIAGSRRELQYLAAWTPHEKGRVRSGEGTFNEEKTQEYGKDFSVSQASKALGRLAKNNWHAGLIPTPYKDSRKILREKAERYGLLDPSFFQQLVAIELSIAANPNEIRFKKTAKDNDWYKILAGTF